MTWLAQRLPESARWPLCGPLELSHLAQALGGPMVPGAWNAPSLFARDMRQRATYPIFPASVLGLFAPPPPALAQRESASLASFLVAPVHAVTLMALMALMGCRSPFRPVSGGDHGGSGVVEVRFDAFRLGRHRRLARGAPRRGRRLAPTQVAGVSCGGHSPPSHPIATARLVAPRSSSGLSLCCSRCAPSIAQLPPSLSGSVVDAATSSAGGFRRRKSPWCACASPLPLARFLASLL